MDNLKELLKTIETFMKKENTYINFIIDISTQINERQVLFLQDDGNLYSKYHCKNISPIEALEYTEELISPIINEYLYG